MSEQQSDASKQNNCNGNSTKVTSPTENQSGQSNQQNVRYIPITLDYDDKVTINANSNCTKATEQSTSNVTNSKTNSRSPQPNHDSSKSGSIFDRVKHFPVNLRSTQRNDSPGRTIPITIENDCQTQPANHSSKSNYDEVDHHAVTKDDKVSVDTVAIVKIQKIQQEIQLLMDRVESFNGTRNDKDYMYIDEMLTQNLLKLDTIDTDGKEKIKLARREAIKCINTCISVLEAKANVQTEQKSNEQSQVKIQN